MSLLRDAPEPPAETAPEHEKAPEPKSERHSIAVEQASELPAKVSPDPAYAPELASVDAELEATAPEAAAVAAKPETPAAAPTAQQEPAPSAKAAPKPVPQPESTPAPAVAPERAAHVQARIIEPEPQPAHQAPEPSEPQVAREAAEVLARRSPGRLSTALSLFGLGIKTLIRGIGRRR